MSLLLISGAYGQNYSYKKKFGTQKNGLYVYWGYNRSIYTKSDINFVGPQYNFTLEKAAAKDRPSNELSDYFNPSKFSVPQFNARIGWYYKFRWDISIGYDHMKYVMRDWQYLRINGVIEGTDNSTLSGVYTNSDGEHLIRPDDLHYENSHGLNYISFQLNNTAPLYKTNNKKFAIQRRLGGGFGPVLTQTDFVWDGDSYQSGYKFGGYGISLHAGLRFDFFNRFFLQNNFASGLIHLPKNRTIDRQDHFAKHKFVYASWEIVGGVLFYLRTKNGCDTCPDWH
ncbi:MAG: hypothetical protein WDZ35_10245 [Crocinitomicaceae bacterium]